MRKRRSSEEHIFEQRAGTCRTTHYVLKCPLLSGFNVLLYVVNMFLPNDNTGNKALPWS